MASITLPNTKAGGSITVEAGSLKEAQQKAADATGVSLSQQQGGGTFGANSNIPTSGGGGGGDSGGGGKASSPDLSGYIAAMQASSGLSIKQLEETKREFDATLAWQQQQWREQGLPELAIKQRTADLEDKKFTEVQRQAQFSEALQTRQQNLDEQVKLGNLSIAQAQQQLAREIQTGQLEVSRGQLGLDTLKTAASLSGPENWIQASNFSRGVAADQRLPGFVSDLLSGRSTAVLGGPQPGAQMSAPLTMQGMAANMGAPVVATAPQAAPAAVAGQQFLATAAQPAPVAPAAGYWSRNQDGSMYFTPNGATPQTFAAPTANVAVPATPVVQPTAPSPMATSADVYRAWGRTPPADPTAAAQDAMRKLFAGGGQALGPQSLEGLTPTERKMMEGGGAALGADVAGFNDQYARSRIGQRTAMPATAAA